MRLRNRPLLPHGLDEALYIGRGRLESDLTRAVRDDRNVLLIGERGTGKTTLVHKLAGDLADRDVRVIDAGPASSTHELIRLIHRALDDADEKREQEHAGDDPVDHVDALDRLPKVPGVVLVIDGPLDPNVAYILFGRLRDQLWRLPYTWIVTATPDEAGALRTPPADAFWSLLLDVGNLDADEIDVLLKQGLEPDELARLREDGAATWPVSAPARHVVRWAQDVLDGRAPTQDNELIAAADALGRQAAIALSELMALDRPAAASDPELLRRLGWTRTNASRWLSRMEEAGIVRSSTGPARGQGRPPKLFEPVRSPDA